ncbi:hypothetical protein J3A64_004184 [Pseudarthrobacter sp. PvP004]|uniref:hypothetical protein n=1 Tax=Pseudarthrobacter sp. PvP004 TaxID=2817850 RepID=UPI002570BB3F|nr:hypothetical protein [Pseudarthrobacter sp. PvP004]MBP2268720.1 hypothetical protein [Pseudarthrobacter sp. PvP004]
MKFQVLDIIPHLKNPVTGEIVSTADRLNQVVETAKLWEAGDPFAGRPEFAGATEPDAAAAVTADHAFNRTDNAHVFAH